MTRFLFGVVLLGSICLPAYGQNAPDQEASRSDSSVAATEEADWLLLPFASYAPETGIAGGVVGGYYRPDRPDRSTSSVQATVTITQERQLIVQATPELYLDEGLWRVQGELEGSHFPNSFYGIGGDTPARAEEKYTADYGVLDATAQRRMLPDLRVGPRIFGRIGSIEADTSAGLIAENRVPGAEGGRSIGLGGSLFWDARNSRYYPTSGSYAEVVTTLHSAVWGSDFTFGQIKTDLRAYQSVGPGVLAGHLYTESVIGEAPFELLPLLGGDERMRGYREGRFRDNVYWTVQAEYRVPLFWRFKATTFASVGEVGPRLGSRLTQNVEAAIGAGGRLRLTEGGVHGRLDVAYSRTGIELYISLGEAF